MKSLSKKQPHIGRNIEHIREIRGMKQEALAQALGISQQTVSKLEQSAEVDDEKLESIATVLGVSKEAIRNFSEDAAINNVHSNHTFNDSSSLNNNFQCTFNPVEKIIQLYDEKVVLLERMLGEKEQMIEWLKEQRSK